MQRKGAGDLLVSIRAPTRGAKLAWLDLVQSDMISIRAPAGERRVRMLPQSRGTVVSIRLHQQDTVRSAGSDCAIPHENPKSRKSSVQREGAGRVEGGGLPEAPPVDPPPASDPDSGS
jgi:hypothetical protein